MKINGALPALGMLAASAIGLMLTASGVSANKAFHTFPWQTVAPFQWEGFGRVRYLAR